MRTNIVLFWVIAVFFAIVSVIYIIWALVDTGQVEWAGATALALVLIAWLGGRSWHQWRHSNEDVWEDSDGSNEDRHQFLGHAAFLLSIISFIGVIYTALPAILSASCR